MTSISQNNNINNKNKEIKDRALEEIGRLLDIMEALRSDRGCPWDKEQTPESLCKYMREETEEAVEAVLSGDKTHINEELGDMLFQVVFQAEIGKEQGDYDLGTIAQAIGNKLIRRHPHVFAAEKCQTPEEVNVLWQEIKTAEKRLKQEGKDVNSLSQQEFEAYCLKLRQEQTSET